MVVALEYDKAKNKCSFDATDWKTAAPLPLEDKVLTLVCGNTSIHWALHSGRRDHFNPTVFWRTPALTVEDMKEDPTTALARHLPPQCHEAIFGLQEQANKANANLVAAARDVPAISIYIISTNPDNELGVAYIFSEICHRMFHVENKDFFTTEQGCYPTMGTDRACALYSAYDSGTYPVLIMDGGTAWTYSGLDAQGKILGGGISPGIGARLRALSDYCGRLPHIDAQEFNDVFQKALSFNAPVPIFAKETKTAMITTTLQEVVGQCRNIVKHFLKMVKDAEGTAAGAPITEKKKPTIMVTGGDSNYLCSILEAKNPVVVVGEPDTYLPIYDYELIHNRHLMHYGVGRLLVNKQDALGPMKPDDELRNRLLGQRVAKEFPIIDVDGDRIYRGTVSGVRRGSTFDGDIFEVRFDDGDREFAEVVEIYDMLKLYVKVGEKVTISTEVLSHEKKSEKKANSENRASELLKRSALVQEHVQAQERKERERKELEAREAEAAAMRQRKAEEEAKRRAATQPEGQNSPKKAKISTPQKPKPHGSVYVNKRVAKFFNMEGDSGGVEDILYFGTITKYKKEDGFWKVMYDDDDEEEFDENDMKRALKLYEERKSDDPHLRRAPSTSAIPINVE